MEIHKPKQVHNWREFLKEYAIIVLGVLTALVGEELVVMVHHHYEVADLRSALHRELAWDVRSIKDAVDDASCIEQRLKEVEAWQVSLKGPLQLQITMKMPALTYVLIRTSTWRSAAAATLDSVPLDKRVAYAQFYDAVDNNNNIRNRMVDAWNNLRDFQNAHGLSTEEARQIFHNVREIRSSYRSLVGNFQTWNAVYIPATGVRIEEAPPRPSNSLVNQNAREIVCKPMIAPEGASMVSPVAPRPFK